MAIGETGQATGAERIGYRHACGHVGQGYRDACGHVGPGRMVALGQGMAHAVRTVALCALSQAVRTVARAASCAHCRTCCAHERGHERALRHETAALRLAFPFRIAPQGFVFRVESLGFGVEGAGFRHT